MDDARQEVINKIKALSRDQLEKLLLTEMQVSAIMLLTARHLITEVGASNNLDNKLQSILFQSMREFDRAIAMRELVLAEFATGNRSQLN